MEEKLKLQELILSTMLTSILMGLLWLLPSGIPIMLSLIFNSGMKKIQESTFYSSYWEYLVEFSLFSFLLLPSTSSRKWTAMRWGKSSLVPPSGQEQDSRIYKICFLSNKYRHIFQLFCTEMFFLRNKTHQIVWCKKSRIKKTTQMRRNAQFVCARWRKEKCWGQHTANISFILIV